MTRRILGVETEYGVIVSPLPGQTAAPLTVEDAVDLMFEGTPHAFRTTNHFLPNGGRLYVDIGSHPEYATAECDSLSDLVANDRAGERLVQQLADLANQRLVDDGVPARIHLLKNNTDSHGATFGCHENYSADRSTDFDTLLRALTTHLTTRILLVGGGDLIDVAGQRTFVLSSRAEHIATEASADPTKDRPLVNTKDEAHADRARWRRLHVISGDSSMSDTTTAVKVGWTARVLDLVEAGGSVDDLMPSDPVGAMRLINRDPTGRVRIATVSGVDRSALEIQSIIVERVLERLGPDPVTDTVGRWLAAIADGATDTIATEVDWVLKRRILQRHVERRAVGWDHPSVARLHLAFHDICPRAGLSARLRSMGEMAVLCSEDAAADAMTDPPATTRARARGRFLGWARDRGYPVSVDWGHVRLDRPVRPQIDLADPFQDNYPEVDRLMAEL